MGKIIRAKDWTNTPLGAPENWPQSLRTTVSTCLNSRFPILIWWGPDLVMIYNDAYRPILGAKHPASMGEKGKAVWPEIWNVIGPMLQGVYEQGIPTWSENQLLLMDRYGYVEETYFTFSYSPIYGESGGIEGVYCAVTETTTTVLHERQLQTLKDLSNLDTTHHPVEEVYASAANALQNNLADFPFAVIYQIDTDGTTASPVAYAGITEQHTVFPSFIDIKNPVEGMHNFCKAFHSRSIIVSENKGRRKKLPKGIWEKEATHFVHIPILSASSESPCAIISAALNPYRKFDDSYRRFASLTADQIALEINNTVLYEQERKKAETLAEIDKAKTVFFSNISHEFRTPLTLILGSLEQMMSNASQSEPGGNKTAIETMHRNALRLLRLVNNLLDFSRIEAGRIKARFELTDIAQLTKDIASSFRSIIENAGLQFEIECAHISEPVYIDRDMWEKILLNLLSNAYKYTLEGKISIVLTQEGHNVLLKVTDTGIGIPASDQEKVFQRFYRSGHIAGRTFEGSGIGLSLIQELAHMHSGKISLTSEEGKGSMFTVSIPTGKQHLPKEQINETVTYAKALTAEAFINESVTFAGSGLARTDNEYPKSPGTIPTVMIVDDNEDMSTYLRSILQHYYRTIIAANGKEAIQKINIHHPDLVISDIMMPVMDGIEMLKILKQDAGTSRIPIILLTARAGEESRIEGYEIGADDYLVKPFSSKELLAKVRAQIRLFQLRTDTEQYLSNLANAMPQLVWIADQDGNVDYYNDRVEEFSGTTRLANGNWRWEGMVHPDDLPATNLAWQQAVETGKDYQCEHRILMKDEQYRWFLSRGIAQKNEAGEITKWYGTTTDIDDQKRFSENLEKEVHERTHELTRTNEELARSNKNLEEFAYAASHDMKEPIRKINYFTERLRESLSSKLSADETRYFNRLETSTNRMGSLIDDLLSYSQISLKPYSLEEVDLNAVLRLVLNDLELQIEEIKATVKYDQLPIIKGYPRQLQQAFQNLISNALKFRKENIAPFINIQLAEIAGKDIPLRLSSEEKERSYYRISFTDNGIGFDQAESSRIFNVFTRLHGNAEYQGTGIGLSIVRKVAENHNGFVSAESAINNGATFSLYFPKTINTIVDQRKL